MATMFTDLLTIGGTHDISNVLTIWAKPIVNGGVAEVDLDNGCLVEPDGYTDEGVLKVKPFEGTSKEVFFVQTVEEEQLLVDLGETDYKCFYNKAGEMLRLYRVETGFRAEASAFDVTGTPKRGDAVAWDKDAKRYVLGTPADNVTTFAVGKLVGIDTDFGYNADKTTYAIEF